MMNKNIFRKLSATALLLLAGFGAANADNKLSMGNLFIKPGETKTVEINLQNDDEISIINCFINLPKGLTLIESGDEPVVDKDKTGATTDSICFYKTAKTDRTKSIAKVQISQNDRQRAEGGQQYTLIIWDFPFATNKLSAGNGAVIALDVKADAENLPGVQDLTLTDMDVLAGKTKIGINDTLAKVINAASDFNVTLSSEGATVKAGEEVTIPVSLKNNAEFWSYVVYVQVPSNLQLVKAEPASRCSGTIDTQDRGNGLYNFMFVPIGLTNITGSEGAILNLTVKAADDFAADTTMTISRFEGMDMDMQYYYAEDLTVNVKFDQTSGINTAADDSSADSKSAVYDLSGRRVSSNAKGVLLKRVNGKMVKVIVK